MQDQVFTQAQHSGDEQVDGYYSLAIEEQGVQLAVYSPKTEQGNPVNEAAIIQELKKQCITEYNYALLIKAVREAAGEPVKIAEAPEYEGDPDIQVLISRDRMEATVKIVRPEKSKPPCLEAIVEKIQSKGIVFGVDHEALQRLVSAAAELTVAKGQPPQNGNNAYIQYYVDLETNAKPAELENGKVDFRNLNLFTTVQQGAVLAEKIPATPGSPGTDVLGNSVNPKPGKDIPLPVGKNTQVLDQTKVVAAIAGQLQLINHKINVLPVIEIKGDVDLSTGNIDFIGNVTVRGSVQSGFTIKAGGNVEIFGTVSGGIVEGKSIVIKMGIQGMGRGYVKASGDVVAKFIENGTVYAGNDVIVSEVVFHSKINAGKRVIVQGRRGLISGGRIVAGEEIVAKTAGTQMATNTELEVGVNPVMREEYKLIRKEIKQLELSLDQTQKALTILKSMDQNAMPSEKREMLLKLTKSQFHLVGQVAARRNRIAEIELALEELKHGRIRVSDIVYPGVKIVVGALIKPVREQLSHSSFYAEDGDIKIGPF